MRANPYGLSDATLCAMRAHKSSPWFLLVAVLFMAAGLRDMFLPGFLSISPNHGDGWTSIALGAFFLILGAVALRQTRPNG